MSEVVEQPIVLEGENQPNVASEEAPDYHVNGMVDVEDTVKLYYELYGFGNEKVLLVMGLGTSALAWLPNVRELDCS